MNETERFIPISDVKYIPTAVPELIIKIPVVSSTYRQENCPDLQQFKHKKH